VTAAAGLPAPRFVLPNGGGWAYGGFELDPQSLAYLATSLPSLPDPLTRGSAWVTLWDALLERRIAAPAFVQLAADALPRETDEQLTQRVLGYLGGAWWRFLSADQRRARAAGIERLLIDGLGRAGTASQKAAWFAALRGLALTPVTLAWLRRVWDKTEPIPGLPLAETDFINLTLDLAVREVPGGADILAQQLARIENPDRKARFEFVMPALSADAEVRARWFRSLADVDRRRREPWVLEGLGYLHHPLRAVGAEPFVAPSLDLLWEIQRTGDIFFPKRWLDATLSGHRSATVAAEVRRFLSSLPAGYPARLKDIVLQSADELFRAADAR
jgi:aminopeptidase N